MKYPWLVNIWEVYIGEVVTPMWLCDAHVATRAKGKGARPPKALDRPPVTGMRCDDCLRAADVSHLGPPTFKTDEARRLHEGGDFNTDAEPCAKPRPLGPTVYCSPLCQDEGKHVPRKKAA